MAPFPDMDPRDYCGRAEEADQLVLQLRDKVDALLLHGAAGLGKSTLALALGWLLQEAGELLLAAKPQ
jgi:predicted ribonuclease YlaK